MSLQQSLLRIFSGIIILLMYIELLRSINQYHVVEAYQKGSEEERKGLDEQIKVIEAAYPGGLAEYYSNGIRLLKESALGINPYANYQIGKPHGVTITYDNPQQFQKYERLGFKQFQKAAFVLVAGGLGQRLGYDGIKVSIPKNLLTQKCFLKYYCEYIRAFEVKLCNGKDIPFVIMTSEDTYAKTIELLEENHYFGLHKDHITILNQEKVPAMIDNEARFGMMQGKLLLQTKPHGHGDVHTLLHMSGTAEKWQKEGKKWIIIFQDTNPFALRSFPLLLGISAEKNFDFNSLAVPRKPGQAVGAITTLVHKENKSVLTVNVEYNQLQGLFKESGGEPVYENGYSKYPGNINCFSIKIDTYVEVLAKTKGLINQFINPKYTDSSKTKFKSSTRLQCLMQDYPKLLKNCDNVGFTDAPRGYCFTALKNDLTSANTKIKQGLSGQGAGSCESDIYFTNRHLLRLCGAEIDECKNEFAGGVQLPFYPMIDFSPHFATCLTELREKVKKVKIVGKSSLIIESDCVLQDLQLDGHYQIHGKTDKVSVKHLAQNYHSIIELQENEQAYLKIRGYKFKKASL